MKKIKLLLMAIAIFSINSSYAGGIMTNTNQSAAWVRMMVRDAVIGIDGVYYNPAGLTKMGEGIFFSVNNQSLVQNRTITSNYSYLNSKEYTGVVNAPLFPSIYAAYNTGNFSFSFGFNAIGGGGGATFDKGLPSFEYGPSELVPGLASFSALGHNITAYSASAYFEGTSIYWGMQLGATYQINDMISVFLGGRYVIAKNTYNGYLKDIMVTDNGTEMRADDFMTTIAAPTLDGVSAQLTGSAAGLQPLIDGGAGGLTLVQAEGLGLIDATTSATIAGGVTSLGQDPTALTIDQIQGVFSGGATQYAAQADQLEATALLLADQEADVVQTGSGFTPIIGVNIAPNDKLNIAIKYEFNTKIELTNETTKDINTDIDPATGNFITMFPDGEKNRADMPGMFSLGVSYKAMDKLTVTVGTHYYFDKGADYGKKIDDVLVANDKVIDKGLLEYALGLEYALNDKFRVSAGYLSTNTGVNEDFQSDLSYSLSTNTVGFGVGYSVTDKIDVNIGAAITSYVDGEKTLEREDPTGATTDMISVKETYDKDVKFLGIGVDFKF
ncbi:MAG: hypothetical protein GXO79_00470 [Chlorobi bacterium]|nr:hypothetical protein [Chlorobiota bacterium]